MAVATVGEAGDERVAVDGKWFALGDRRFPFHGVTYGTFRPREDGARFPERDRMKRDLFDMAAAGFTVVRTYTPPPDDLLDLAGELGLRVLAGIFYPDWRYLHGSSRRDQARVARDALAEVGRATDRMATNPTVLGVSVGNEMPADVVRWVGTRRARALIEGLAAEVRGRDPRMLVTYANYPTAEYLAPRNLDFVMFNVFLEQRDAFRRYLTRLQNLAGDAPLVLGEVGLHSGPTGDGEERQAEVLDWQLTAAVERGVAGACVFSWTDEWWVGDDEVSGWNFGVTRADRSPKPALQAVSRHNRGDVGNLDFDWPSVSVVICAYNASSTLDECLRHVCALEYPDIELIVVDDGSTDDTAGIAARHPTARLVTIEHGGLSVARNAGWVAATGELVAYLDSDAYPSPEWLWYLALAFDDARVGGAGGPNLPPVDDPPGAAQVAQAPGGPVHVLLTDDRAEHVPGCNMAFWRDVLEEVGGFDPVYTSAGDDVDLCWKVLDRGWEIGFHPAALVWHHRRAGMRPYLRQQRGYGRSEALVEARHPDRFNSAGAARWRGRIYNPVLPAVSRPRIYRGQFGTAPFQSVYQAGGHGLDFAHQIGVPLAVALTVLTVLAPLVPALLVVGGLAVSYLLALGAFDAGKAQPPRGGAGRGLGFRLGVATMTLAQPLFRTWGRARARRPARDDLPDRAPLSGIGRPVRGGIELVTGQERSEVVRALLVGLRRRGIRVVPGTGWDEADATLLVSPLLAASLVSSAYPEGTVQLTMRRRLRPAPVAVTAAAVAGLLALRPVVGLIVAGVVLVELARGSIRARTTLRRLGRIGS
jgi:glycosyltransferase involved in cell wall biosynthesis